MGINGRPRAVDWPRVYLALDNCFASKRWTRPMEWAQIARDLGIAYVEASADTECDPLYTTPEYLEDWIAEAQAAEKKTGVKVANLYSGHGTYATLGLAHTDSRVRRRMLDGWLKVMARTAGRLGAGLGFFCHAFPDATLQDREAYLCAEGDLIASLAELAMTAAEFGVATAGVEQMYTPSQIPWTLEGAARLVQQVCERSRQAFYITVDTGHHVGQRRFQRPGYGRLKEALRQRRHGSDPGDLWLGPRSAYRLFEEALARPPVEEDATIRRLEQEMDAYPHLFAAYDDGDPYLWLERLGCYSPIIHLQQTTGRSSAHLPFTPEQNRIGVIQAERVLQALAAAYAKEPDAGLPPRCRRVYLTLEIFAATVDMPCEILQRLAESVRYWRTYVPEDGLVLGELPSHHAHKGRQGQGHL